MEAVPCEMCREGLTYNSAKKRYEPCEVCGGTQKVTPGTICQCGRSCTKEEDGKAFCGRAECLKELKDAGRWTDVGHFGYHGYDGAWN